jgi:hypothetical protein
LAGEGSVVTVNQRRGGVFSAISGGTPKSDRRGVMYGQMATATDGVMHGLGLLWLLRIRDDYMELSPFVSFCMICESTTG